MNYTMMCPHCGELLSRDPNRLIPTHDYHKPVRAVCPGSGQNPRCAASDGRRLWNGELNPHFVRETPKQVADRLYRQAFGRNP